MNFGNNAGKKLKIMTVSTKKLKFQYIVKELLVILIKIVEKYEW